MEICTKVKRRWKIMVTVLVLAIIGYLLLMPSSSYRRDLEAYKQNLRAKGEKIGIADLMTPRRTTNMSQGAQLFMAMTNLSDWTNIPARMSLTDTNLTPAKLAEYRRNIQTLGALRAVLGSGSLDFNPDYSLGAELPLPHLSRYKQAEQFAAGLASQALALKDVEEAWPDLLLAVDVFRLMPDEPTLISGLVRIADLNIAVPVTLDALEEPVWTDAQLGQLQARWDGMDLFTNSDAALAMEFAFVADIMVKIRKHPDMLPMYASVTGTTVGEKFTGDGLSRIFHVIQFHLRIFSWRSTWSYDEELRYLQVIFAAKESAREIYKTGAFVPAYNELLAQYTNINNTHAKASGHYLLFGPIGDGAFLKYLMKSAVAETQRRMVVTAIALERHRRLHGVYPARLEQLTPDLLTRVPLDLMDGRPLRYQLQSNGDYLLYSVGQDGKDDQGGGDDSRLARPLRRGRQ